MARAPAATRAPQDRNLREIDGAAAQSQHGDQLMRPGLARLADEHVPRDGLGGIVPPFAIGKHSVTQKSFGIAVHRPFVILPPRSVRSFTNRANRPNAGRPSTFSVDP